MTDSLVTYFGTNFPRQGHDVKAGEAYQTDTIMGRPRDTPDGGRAIRSEDKGSSGGELRAM